MGRRTITHCHYPRLHLQTSTPPSLHFPHIPLELDLISTQLISSSPKTTVIFTIHTSHHRQNIYRYRSTKPATHMLLVWSLQHIFSVPQHSPFLFCLLPGPSHSSVKEQSPEGPNIYYPFLLQHSHVFHWDICIYGLWYPGECFRTLS